jgi:hypothetical protein
LGQSTQQLSTIDPHIAVVGITHQKPVQCIPVSTEACTALDLQEYHLLLDEFRPHWPLEILPVILFCWVSTNASRKFWGVAVSIKIILSGNYVTFVVAARPDADLSGYCIAAVGLVLGYLIVDGKRRLFWGGFGVMQWGPEQSVKVAAQ